MKEDIKDYFRDQFEPIRNIAKPDFLVTHGLRLVPFSLFIMALVIGFAVFMVIALVAVLSAWVWEPLVQLSETVAAAGTIILEIAKAVGIALLSLLIFILAELILLKFLIAMMNSLINFCVLSVRGQCEDGEVIKTWNTTRYNNRTGTTLVTNHYQVEYTPVDGTDRILLEGFSQETWLQKLFEKKLTTGQTVTLQVDPKEPRRARVVW